MSRLVLKNLHLSDAHWSQSMTNHPITPPPELVQQWIGDYYGCPVSGELAGVETAIATRAAQWGLNQPRQ
jgi:hypothetical protein